MAILEWLRCSTYIPVGGSIIVPCQSVMIYL